MSLPHWIQVYADALHSGHADAAQYVVAYLSSSGVEALAVAAAVSVVAYRLGRGVFEVLSAHETPPVGQREAFR